MSTIKTGTTLTTAYQVEGDTTGALVIQTGASPTTAVTIGSDQSTTLAGTLNLASQNMTPYTGFKNRIINGAMMVNQRGTVDTPVTANNGVFGADRFAVSASASSKGTIQQSSTAPAGFTNSLLFTSSAATSVGSTDYYSIFQRIEGYNVADLGWGTANAATVTLSFWVRSSLTGTFGASVFNGAANRSYPFSYTISAANTWEQKTVTIAGDTTGTWSKTTSNGMTINFSMGMGSTYSGTANAWAAGDYESVTGAVSVVGTSGATWYVTGVQIEKGSTATSFDYRPYGTELALCQRYAVMINSATSNGYFNRYGTGINAANNATNIMVSLPCPMRIVPSLTTTSVAGFAVYYAGNSYACNAVTMGGDGNTISSFAQINGNIATASLVNGGASMLMSNSNITSSLLFSAEL